MSIHSRAPTKNSKFAAPASQLIYDSRAFGYELFGAARRMSAIFSASVTGRCSVMSAALAVAVLTASVAKRQNMVGFITILRKTAVRSGLEISFSPRRNDLWLGAGRSTQWS